MMCSLVCFGKPYQGNSQAIASHQLDAKLLFLAEDHVCYDCADLAGGYSECSHARVI